jgi:hypothetical protein
MAEHRNYTGLSKEQLQQFRLLYEGFSQKDRTIFKDGVGSLVVTFANRADMLVWDALVKKEMI